MAGSRGRGGDDASTALRRAALRRFQRMLDNHVDDEEPAPPGCSAEILIPLRASRARANRMLLDD
ncbi:hypothetical protein [Candidatus Poriferisodalis sp.]|uniref:hypothetical protein n=1 Tax=Candidatus Poriferisodalis sp. TaxID=3101277 RepID=UPI003B02A697